AAPQQSAAVNPKRIPIGKFSNQLSTERIKRLQRIISRSPSYALPHETLFRCLIEELHYLLCAAPGKRDARAAMSVVMQQEAIWRETLGLHSHHRAHRAQPTGYAANILRANAGKLRGETGAATYDAWYLFEVNL